ncbi:Uncharacterised protein [Candidatus Tiddalikarchaeum anstoanum]|nr:Uncharacterised protein [Candidatus Tiddalikarchaeum anstoanum]
MFLVFGNHPKANSIKERALVIIKFLKGKDWVDLNDIQKELNIDRNESPSMFYKPLSAMKRWKLLDSKRQVTGGRGVHVIYTTYYKFTPDHFLTYLKDTLYAVCDTELKMFK